MKSKFVVKVKTIITLDLIDGSNKRFRFTAIFNRKLIRKNKIKVNKKKNKN